MTKEEIEEQLTILSEEDDDWDKVRYAFNLGLRVAAESVKLKTKGKMVASTGYSQYKTRQVIDKKSILKYKL